MTKKILIINPFGIGDVLFSTPLISALKEESSGYNIAYICNMRTEEILATNPAIDKVFVFERDEYRALWRKSRMECAKKFYGFWREIRRRRFDIAIDLSLGKEYAFLCWLAGIKERRGFNYKGRGRFLTHGVQFGGFNDKPVAEYYLDIIRSRAGALPVAQPNTVLLTTYGDKEYIDKFLRESGVKTDDILVGIAPGGGITFGKRDQGRRRWGAKKFSKLADEIIKSFNAKVVLIWGPGEEDLVEEIKRFMKEKSLVAPKTSIREMAVLCKRCRMVICSEGGPLHIASSQGVRTVSIFGAVDERVYGPYPPGENNIVISSSADCRPCYKGFKIPECDTKKCLEDISVDSIFDIIRGKL